MALAMDESTLAAINSGEVVDRGLILFGLGDPLDPTYYGFWTGQGTLDVNGISYVGAGKLIEVDAIPQVTDGSSVAVTARLSTIPDTDLTIDVLATIEQEIYHQRPVWIMTAYFDSATRILLSVEVEYRGRIDKLTHQEKANGDAVLIGNFESRSRDFLKKGYRMRTDADQRVFAPNDGSLRHVQKAAVTPIYFGRDAPNSPQRGALGPSSHQPMPSVSGTPSPQRFAAR